MITKNIRVCFVSPKAYPIFNPDIESVFGGAEVDTYMIATELAKDDAFDVSFIVADYGQPEDEIRENVRLLKSVDFKQNPLTGAFKIWKALRKTDADVYLMKTASPGVPLVQYFCQKKRRRFVYKTAHLRECDGTYLKMHPILGRLFIRSLKKACPVITQNESDRGELLQRFRIHSIPISNAHRINECGNITKRTILWVGRTAAFKQPQRFLELARQFPDEPFIMICQRATGDTDFENLKAAAAKIDNLEFIERVPFKEVDRYFEQAKVFVNTSDAEGFPNTFIQACKAGTAILSYAVNPDGFLDRYRCGVCCGGDDHRLTEVLQDMLSEQRHQRLGENGLEYVRQQHDIVKNIEQYKRIFYGKNGVTMAIRVLHIIGSLRLGGAQVVIKQIVEHNDDPNIEHFVYPLRCQQIDIPIRGNILSNRYGNYDLRKFFDILRICKQHKIDIIHAHLHKPILGALLTTYFQNIPVIVHEHGPIGRRGLQYSVYRFMLRLLKSRAQTFIAVSKAIADKLTKYAAVDPYHIQLVYNAVDLQKFKPKAELRESIRNKLGTTGDSIVIGYAGRLSHVKGPDILLDAFVLLARKHSNYTLFFLGNGEMGKELHSKAENAGLADRVKFLGFRDNVAEIMNAFDVGCVPSRQEAFGIIALEMMSMGIPLVSSGAEGLAELTQDCQNALLARENTPAQIADGIERLIHDEKLRDSLLKNASNMVQKFDVSNLSAKISSIYHDIANRKSC